MCSKKIGILGGSFNPPHSGHINIAMSAYQKLGLEKVLFIPCGLPPHKQLPCGTPGSKARLDMLELAVNKLPFAEVCDIELNRPGKSFTIDTLTELCGKFPDYTFYLIIGSDMLLTFEKWKDFDKILNLAVLTVFCRLDGQYEELSRVSTHLREQFGAKIEIIRQDAIEISSTSLRRALGIGQYDPCSLCSDVFDYIRRNNLYNWNEQLYRLRAAVCKKVSPKRFQHILGCEKMAAALAMKWGADQQDARIAAILHDITRELMYEKQLKLCEDYGIITDDILELPEITLHAVTAAAICVEQFHMPSHIADAIRWHTTARKNMSLLEKIIYLADGIEQTRHFDGVDKIRRLAFRDLDAALMQSIGGSIEYIRKCGRSIARDTIEAYNYLCSAGQAEDPASSYELTKPLKLSDKTERS